MISNKSNYDMDGALHEIEEKQLILDAKIDTQVLLQILIHKGIITRDEVFQWRENVANSPKYKATINYLQSAKQKAQYYKDNPQEHLKDLLNAKINGAIK